MTVYIVDLESVPTRYTVEWKESFPKLLSKHGHNVVVIDGPNDIPECTTPGAFLNFGGTNIYKSVQVEKIARLFTEGKVKNGDNFIFTDSWHPGIINLKYMSELLGVYITIHGLWHAGSYDPQDFLGRLIGSAPWVRHTEKALYHAIDRNYFATDFHIQMFCKNLLGYMDDSVIQQFSKDKIVRTGWPMEYMDSLLTPYKNMEKRNLILFPHRIAPEKQVEIFRDLKYWLPQYEFVICQEQHLTKNEYHNLLGEAKLVFSANLQETLGISCYEGAVVDAIPMVPDRLSYSEMYLDTFKYPSEWTINWGNYNTHRQELCYKIIEYMENYKSFVPKVQQQAYNLKEHFFSSSSLLGKLI